MGVFVKGTTGQGRDRYQVSLEEDERPSGSLLFGDPSMARMTRHVHTFNEPHNPNNAVGEQRGIDSLAPDMIPWHDMTGNNIRNAWGAMNKKRGTEEAQED